MSAPLILTASDLRSLANAIDKLTLMQRADGVGPNAHDPQITIDGELSEMTFALKWTPTSEGANPEWVIDDRYGS